MREVEPRLWLLTEYVQHPACLHNHCIQTVSMYELLHTQTLLLVVLDADVAYTSILPLCYKGGGYLCFENVI